MLAAQQQRLQTLLDEPFETGRLVHPRVDRYSEVSVRTNGYSVPIQLIGPQLRVQPAAAAELGRHRRPH
jgi:hypothetical protein